MTRAWVWTSVVILASLALCGCQREGNAFFPTMKFVDGLKKEGERVAKAEVVRLNELERASKDKVRFEKSNNPMIPGGGVYFKLYREYTAARLKEIRRSDSYLNPVVFEIVFNYRAMATPSRHTDYRDSPQKAQADTEFKLVREDSVSISYYCDPFGKLTGSLPGLLPRDAVLNPTWNKNLAPGAPLVSPVEDAPATPTASGPQAMPPTPGSQAFSMAPGPQAAPPAGGAPTFAVPPGFPPGR